MSPKIRANRYTYRWAKSPASICCQPQAKVTMPLPRIKAMPPMVGVPALELCQVGPSCRISCPAFSFRSSASTNLPRIMVSTQPASNAT